MASFEDVERLVLALPATQASVTGAGQRRWEVRGKSLVWERPLRKADLAALGEAAPDGPVLGAHVADVGVKEALIADEPEVFFTTPHFDGYPMVLVQLDRIGPAELEELISEAWLLRAPRRLVAEHPELVPD